MKYIHYHVVRFAFGTPINRLDFGEFLPDVYTMESGFREAAYRNVVDPDYSHVCTICFDDKCDKTRRPI